MSVIFEGLLLQTKFEDIVQIYAQWSTKLKLRFGYICNKEILIIFNDDQDEIEFIPEMEEMAIELSKTDRKVLLIRFNSSLDITSSTLFLAGKIEKAFDELDNLYAPINADGEIGSERFTKEQLKAGERYIVAITGIDLGLKVFGQADASEEFLDFMSGGYDDVADDE